MRPLILVTNDDGMFAPGIKALVSVAKEYGDVVVVAPDSPQSGQGHAITIIDPLRLNRVEVFDDIEAYECSGTPVDCVKLAKHVVLKDRRMPDLCVSGINHGSNASINIIYSGTMSAAMEASLGGIPSIGFSYLDYSFEADFTTAKHYAGKLIEYMLNNKDKTSARLLNVNIPILPLDQVKGVKVCRQAEGNWNEKFIESSDPRGQKYYWMAGNFGVETDDKDTDIEALKDGYISVVPCAHDLTHYRSIPSLSDINSIS